MSDFQRVNPPAASLVEALRSIGYSLQTAIADLIDNSITAQAGNIWLDFNWDGHNSHISLLDDGTGMTEDELVVAMLPGSKSPTADRDEHDLGRFGLGLKTASFSQCRQLTVASKKNGVLSLRSWDLDHVVQCNEWQLLCSVDERTNSLFKPLEQLEQGTLVIWQKMDRVTGNTRTEDGRSQNAFYRKINEVVEHVEMVFHQFLEGRARKLDIYCNGNKLTPWDPFISDFSSATPVELIRSDTGNIELRGFVLPHWDQIEDTYKPAGPYGWSSQQGFYLYRNKRLLLAGGWLGLDSMKRWPLEEQYKLARIKIEITGSMDHEWQIDVKKSTGRIPERYRERIARLAKKIREDARRVLAFRGTYGKRANDKPEHIPIWERRHSKDGNRYVINRKHPLVLYQQDQRKGKLEIMLKLLEMTVPVDQIWLDVSEQNEKESPSISKRPSAELIAGLKEIFTDLMNVPGMARDQAINIIQTMTPFNKYQEIEKYL